MTTQESKQQYEGAILQQLIKNAEELAVIKFELQQSKPVLDKVETINKRLVSVENDLTEIKKSFQTAKWFLITIAVGVLINIISPPIVTFFNH